MGERPQNLIIGLTSMQNFNVNNVSAIPMYSFGYLDSRAYISIEIVNPFKSEILTYTNTPIPKYSFKSEDKLTEQDLMSVLFNKKEYSTLEKVKIQTNGFDLQTNAIRGLGLKVEPDLPNVEKNKFLHSPFVFSVYNLSGRKNPYSIYYTEDGLIKCYKYSVIGIPLFTINRLFKLGNYASN